MVYRALGQVIGWWNDHAAEIRQVVTVIYGAVKVAVSAGPTGSDPSTAIIAELRQQNAHLPSACQALATGRGFSRQPAAARRGPPARPPYPAYSARR